METYSAIANEQARLRSLRRVGVLDDRQEPALDRIVRLTSDALDMPIASISLIDEELQWIKAAIGITTGTGPRDLSFCVHALKHPGEVLVVDNPLEDSRFRDNPYVTGPFKLRFYAGAPLVTDEGHAIGTLYVIDTKPRPALEAEEARVLSDLADTVVDELELQRAVREAATAALVAEEINAAKNAFMASLSHEFRTLMTSIMGFGELLAMDWSSVADRNNAYAQEIVRSSEQVLALVNDLIDLSRIEAGQVTLDIQAVPMVDEVYLANSLLADQAADHGVRLDNRVRPDAVARTDAVRLHRLLINLISSAIRLAGRGALITMTDRALPGGRIAVDLAGTGGPMGAVLLSDRDNRLDGRLDGMAAGGRNIGMMIAHRMAVAMHGDIDDSGLGQPGGPLSLLLPAAG